MRKPLSFHYITLLLFCQILFCFASAQPASAVNTENFYFDKFEADYYLSKDSQGVSQLKVVENFITVFPNYNQNKGICRMIPNTNQGGINRTLEKLNRSNIKVLRNDKIEPIYSIEKSKSGYYEVCTGNDDYVLGTQKYTFEYTFTKVVTEFSNNDREWQELYWDTNGNGWAQRFNKLTVNVHVDDPEMMTGEIWCYVGKYGESGQDRCNITKNTDGFTFSTGQLSRDENLTYVIEFKSGSFIIPMPEKDYTYCFVAVAAVVIFVLFILWEFYHDKKINDKRDYYRHFFVKPEYIPHPKYHIQELSEAYIGKLKDVRTATLLEMVVSHKIQLIKGEKKAHGASYNWTVRVINLNACNDYEKDLLAILNNGSEVANDTEIKVKAHTATPKLFGLGRNLERFCINTAINDGLLEKGARSSKNQSSSTSGAGIFIFIIALVIFYSPAIMAIQMDNPGLLPSLFGATKTSSGVIMSNGKIMEGFYFAIILIVVLVIAAIVVTKIFGPKNKQFKYITNEGIRASRYLDGLKLYISMAETERLAFLQSIKGADTTPEGIVRLYEKLLPYAALFGLEESWMKELNRYCITNAIPIDTMDVSSRIIFDSNFTRAVHTASNYMSSSTNYHNSSYSSSSSSGGGSFSSGGGGGGGGGGGFSGGGGGGGGGHGR